jgi:hypothetical protein
VKIDPNGFAPNEAWLLFQLNDAPVRTEADGDFNALAIMDVATGLILGMELIGSLEDGPSESASRKLLASAESEAGRRPQRLFIDSAAEMVQMSAAANAFGLEVQFESARILDPLTQEAREGFAAHVSGGRRQ